MVTKKIIIASDHAGYNLKKIIGDEMSKSGHKVLDIGTNNLDPVDYPDFGHLAAKEYLKGTANFGIIFCGSGLGISMAANKHNGIRAALCYDIETAKLARSHNDANFLALGGRVIEVDLAKKCVNAFINTPFDGGRHLNRVKKIDLMKIERFE
ncbi:MAG: putative ribose-5-phosphate isomerase B [Alphaproteobacteria bacterium MarineAlpha2_Bin1]|nr:MAG: putative ribose-5-phosphate isomerase B [Alphaproteobacteria bacterium MarineAlpha2_Bin1]